MPAIHTFQIAIRNDGQWVREYVCAPDKTAAVFEYLEQNPMYTLEWLLQADQFEVEACA